jgi:hypothetical protein
VDDTPANPEQPRREGTGGTIVVAALLVLIAAGTAAWFAMDHGRDVLSKDKGTIFAAAFEKECLPAHGKETCRATAGKNHSRCLRDSATQTDAGIEYDREIYLKCMRAALDTPSSAP